MGPSISTVLFSARTYQDDLDTRAGRALAYDRVPLEWVVGRGSVP